MDLISFLGNLRARLPISSPEAFKEIIAETLGANDYKIHIEPARGDIFRAVIGKQFSRGNFTKKITHQGDGIIIDNTGHVYVVPLQRYNPNANHARVAQALAAGKYTVQCIYDGSIVTLYYYESRWRISSASGYDVGGVKWIGEKTYEEILQELLPEDFYARLDTDKCYTIGFRHAAFHPLAADPARVWFMRAVDLGAINCDNPREVYINEAPAGLTLPETPPQRDFDALLATNASALGDYYASGKLHYGYMLRGDFDDLGDIANVMLESQLMKTVRLLFYNNTKHIDKIKLTNENRISHIALRAYLTHQHKYDFVQLFPQFKNYYDMFDGIFNDVAKQVMGAMRQVENKKKLESFRRVVGDYRRYGVIMEVAAFIYHKFESKHIRGFNIRKEGAKSIIMDQITDRALFLYYCGTILNIVDSKKK